MFKNPFFKKGIFYNLAFCNRTEYMRIENCDKLLFQVIEANTNKDNANWLLNKIDAIIANESTRDLYMTYSLIASKFKPGESLVLELENEELKQYLKLQNASIAQLARIYLLIRILTASTGFFKDKVANIIQIADTGELETFLKYLVLLPNAEDFSYVAVDALRTNIASIFDAISAYNPYPTLYFDDQQWNQMFLKAAFMDRDLTTFNSIDKKANKDLARIISDYAHERWAAGREIDPHFWRPVSKYIQGVLVDDMQRLLQSENTLENRAGALCCYKATNEEAIKLLQQYPNLLQQLKENKLTWVTLKD